MGTLLVFAWSDVLQMMGRAGRPQFDDHGVAVILVHDVKKHFYKKFIYEPFPVESRYDISMTSLLLKHTNTLCCQMRMSANTIADFADFVFSVGQQ